MTIQEVVAKGFRWHRSQEHFWALRDVSFRVASGTTVGIVGANGSGKSTLLRLIGGVGRADTGGIEVHGRIGALLDLGAGFHPDLSGRENATLAGLLNGLTRTEVRQRFDAIVRFAELEKVIENPVRTYSTGMLMRLAFAAAVHAEPEVLLIDEVLSVGDLGFQRKCLDRIAEFKESGCSILLVSHESSVIQEMCDEVIWLHKGRLVGHGSPDDIIRQYIESMQGGGPPLAEEVLPVAGSPAATTVRTAGGADVILDGERFGSTEIQLTAVRVLHRNGRTATELRACQPMRVEIEFHAPMRVVAPIFCVRIERDDGVVCYVLTTENSNLSLGAIEGSGQVTLDLERVDLNSGRYTLDASCYAQDWVYAYDYRKRVRSFVVRGDGMESAILNSPFQWALRTE